MPSNLNAYASELKVLVEQIKASFDRSSDLVLKSARAPNGMMLATRLSGSLRRDRVVLLVKEQFNYDVAHDRIEKDYRYTFNVASEELLRLETQPGYPEHAHFPRLFLSGIGRHFDKDRWGPDLQDMDFLKAFRLWSEIRLTGGQLPEPFRSAAG